MYFRTPCLKAGYRVVSCATTPRIMWCISDVCINRVNTVYVFSFSKIEKMTRIFAKKKNHFFCQGLTIFIMADKLLNSHYCLS